MPRALPYNFISPEHVLGFYRSSLLPLFWIRFPVDLFLYTSDPVSFSSHSFSLLMAVFDIFQCTKLFKSTPSSSHAKKMLIGGEGRGHNKNNFVYKRSLKSCGYSGSHCEGQLQRVVQSAVKQVSLSRKHSAKNSKFHGSYTGILLWSKFLHNI